MINIILYFITSVFAATGIFFFQKIKLKSFSYLKIDDVINVFFQLNFWLGIIFYGLSFILLFYMINVYNAGISIISLLGVYIIVMFFSGIIFMEETLTVLKIIAIILIILGIFLLQK